MNERVTFLNRIYVRHPDSKYLSHQRYYRRKRYDSRTKKYKWDLLHRVIWEHYNGKIPSDCVIHHKDGNPLNNNIENLECIPGRDHLSKYHDGTHRYKNAKERLCLNCGEGFLAKTKRSRYCLDCSNLQWIHLKK